MIGRRAGIGFHTGYPERRQAHGDRGAGEQTKNTAAGDVHEVQKAGNGLSEQQLGSAKAHRNPPQNQHFSVFS
jgi:hypothetical protein